MFVKYVENVEASIVVICCSTRQCQGSFMFLKFHMPLYSMMIRSGLYFFSNSSRCSGVKSASLSTGSSTELLLFKRAGEYSFSPSSHRMISVFPLI